MARSSVAGKTEKRPESAALKQYTDSLQWRLEASAPLAAPDRFRKQYTDSLQWRLEGEQEVLDEGEQRRDFHHT